jgi:broad specificity phosphatase PhoE
MTALVYLVRHAVHEESGRALSGRNDVRLSERGREQATRLGQHLRRRDVRALQSSPRIRARETAAILGHALGLGVEIVEALDEIDFGAWSGLAFAELEEDARWRRWNEARGTAAIPGGETMGQAVERIAGHLARIARDGPTPVVCVSHCDIIRGAVARILGLDLDHLLRFDVDEASITSIVVGDWGARLTGLNEGAA